MSHAESTTPPPATRWVPAVAGGYAIAGGLATLTGWAADVPRLTDWDNNGISMMPNMAVALTCMGAALVLLSLGRRWLAAIVGLCAGLIGAATLFQYFSGISLGIDTLLFHRPWGQRGTLTPGRMGPPGSTSLTLLGTALLLTALGRTSRRVAVVAGTTVIGIASLSLSGYLFGASALYTLPKLTTIALPTATILLALGVGLVASVPEAEPMRTLCGNSAASTLVRRTLPFLLLVPIGLGWLRLQGQNAGLYDTAFGTAARSVLEVALLLTLLWWAAAAVRAREEPLHESRELLRVTLASIGDAVITTDTQGRITYLNAVAESLTGWKHADAAGRPLENVLRIVNEATRKPVENPAARALREGALVGLANHTVLRAKDGTERPIDDSAAPIRDGTGAVIGVVLVFHDITGRRQAEQALRRSERELADFFEHASVGLHRVGADGTILQVNQTELDLLGYPREEYVGRNIAEFHVDRPVIENILTRLTAGETIREVPARLRCQDGSIRDVLINSNVFFEDGRFIHTRCFTLDVTARKRAEESLRQSEERFRAIADNIPQLAWMAAPGTQGQATWFNKAWLDYTGTTLEQNQGSGWQAVHHPDYAGAVIRKFEQHVSESRDWEDTFPLRGKDGQYRWFLSRMNVIRDEAGTVTRIFGTNTDVTEQRAAEEALRRAQTQLTDRAAQLERAVAARTAELTATNEQLEAFVYSIAHDLRAPLRTMSGFSQILLDEHSAALAPPAQQMLTRIQASSEFMDKLLLDLLAYGCATRAEMELGPVKVGQAWEAALYQTADQAAQARAHIEVIGPLPVVLAHEATLSQCLANLLSNALKFVEPGVPPHVRFRAEEIEPAMAGGGAGKVRLWMEDNGIGIAPQHHELAFRVFERLHATRYPGTGIGLSIVRKGAERMGGRAGLESAPGQGSRFWIELRYA